MNGLSIFIGYVMDLIIGDPYSFPHPVRYIAKLIKVTENIIRKFAKSDKALKACSFILWFVVVWTTFVVTFGVLNRFKDLFGDIGYIILNSIIIYTTLATKCLKDEAVKIYNILKEDDIEKARIQVSYIVGRDTTTLNKQEIIRATVETVAENTVDGIISPMFYAFIGGGPLAMAYKAVNTLDSMVGYKNEKYLNLGFASAKIDDIANFIPARISLLLMTIASLLLGYNYKQAFKIGYRDRKNHKSPNCAYSEGAVAGALDIQLGGTNIYFGKEVYKPTIGDKIREIESEDIINTNKIMYMSSLVGMIVFTSILLVVDKLI